MAVISNNSKAPKGAVLQTVHGEIFKNERVVSTYKADTGSADKKSQILTLTGGVQVVSNDPKMTLTCDQLTYDSQRKLMKAKGHVAVTGELSTVGTLDELWSTSDFSKIASPELFDKP